MTRVVLALALCCIPLTKLLAAPSFQFERIKSFGTPSPGAEPPGPDLSAEGGHPFAPPVQATDGNIYGITRDGGVGGSGAIFKLSSDGTGFTELVHLGLAAIGTYAYGALIQGSDGALYGTSTFGGGNGYGTVFKLNLDGSGVTVLHDFDYGTGVKAYTGLVQGADGALYGTTSEGGSYRAGTVFKLNTDGTGFTVLQHLDYYTTGAYPSTGLIQGTDGALYGTTSDGGSYYAGTVFKLNTDGTGFTVLQHLDYYTTGAYPSAGLMQGTDGALYGANDSGGSLEYGTLFKLNTDGSDFTVLRSFDNFTTGYSTFSALMQGADGTLYGTATYGGSSGAGTAFTLNTDGSEFTVFKNFDYGADGGVPYSGLVKGIDGNIYGTTVEGGDAQAGTVYRLVFGDIDDLCLNVTCTASDQCHDVGTCDPSTGLCSNPAKVDGSSCSDGSACTQTDTCQAGACVGTNYSWSGFQQPVNGDGTSVFKLGRTIPVKFQLTGACSGNTGLIANIYFYQLSSGEGPVNDAGPVFRYSGDQYIFNLGTKGLTTGIWNLGVDLHDGMGIRNVTVGLRN